MSAFIFVNLTINQLTSFFNRSEFFGFASETMSPTGFLLDWGLRIGLASHSHITSILLVWNQDVGHLLVCLGLLFCWNTHFLLRQHDLVKHFNVYTQIHDQFVPVSDKYASWRSMSKSPHHDACVTTLSSLWLELRVWGLSFSQQWDLSSSCWKPGFT